MKDRRILVVDDDPHIVRLLREKLGTRGRIILEAGNGLEAVKAALRDPPDLVVLDVMMPRKDGYKLCRELKADKSTRDIPVILLTAVGEAVPSTTYTHAEGMSTEAEDFIPKPVDVPTLVEAVERLL